MCLSCQTCILCALALPPVSVMRAAFVLVLGPACNPVACCTCFCRRHIPVLASALCLTPVGVLIPVCSPSRTLSPFAGQAGHTPLCVLGVTWRRHVSPSPAMLETWRVKPSLWVFGRTLPGLGRGRWEEEEETVFIRGVNTNEDSPNAQHAPHRPRSGHRCNECAASLHA